MSGVVVILCLVVGLVIGFLVGFLVGVRLSDEDNVKRCYVK